MADISKIKLPSNDIYNIKDDYARDRIIYAKEVSGENYIVTFSDGADNFPVSELIVDISPIQLGTGDPSSENIRAIYGWDGVLIRHTRKNLWGGSALLDDIKAAVPTATVDSENRTIKYAAGSTATNPLCGEYDGMRRGFQFAENTQYTFIITMYRTGSSSNMRVYYTDGTYDNIPASSDLETKGTVVFVSASGKSVKNLYKLHGGGYTTFYADESGIFEGVLTAEDFEAYSGTEMTIEFPSEAGTVYGGILDVTAGTLTVTWVKQQITTVTSGETNYAITRLGDFGLVVNVSGICNMLVKAESVSGIEAGNFVVLNSDGYNRAQIDYAFPGATGTNGAATKAATQEILDGLVSDGTPMEVAYMLAEPLVYTLTPVQISSLVGINNIYANSGSIQKMIYARNTFNDIAQLASNLYSLSISNGRITLTSSSGKTSYVDLPVYDGTVV